MKCLEEDLDSNPAFQQKKTDLHTSWVQRGLMPPTRSANERIALNTLTIPEECARELLEVVRRHLQPCVKKADSQIKATKKRLSTLDAKGLLLLVNEGNYMMKPSVVGHVVARLLNNGNYSHINSVVYCSLNVRANVPGVAEPVRIWLGGYLRGRERVDKGFIARLGQAWNSHEEAITGTRINQIVMASDYETINGVRFDKPHL